ncbi:isoprenoid synthase domain-containing protein [Collybia nuda]|uniref:Terpene synthase n=1 Tax=Collybia nuda TaxID=64659 RepID=A0A9P6CHI3_9AGAR|nr:isoprenoid synthase domain-containing protein [Collybia nuda]
MSKGSIKDYFDWSASQIQQCSNRNINHLPTVDEFIIMRRCTVGAGMVEAMVEHSLNIDLPSYVFKDPVVISMSQAISDIISWSNDIYSFHKEQRGGDSPNLICVLQP